MHICVIAHAVNRFAGHYIEAFRARGHEVSVVALGRRVEPPWSTDAAAYFVGDSDFEPSETNSRVMPYLKMVFPLRRLMRELQPDVVFALYLSSAGLLASLSGHRRVVLSARGGDVNSHIGSFV